MSIPAWTWIKKKLTKKSARNIELCDNFGISKIFTILLIMIPEVDVVGRGVVEAIKGWKNIDLFWIRSSIV